MFGNYTARAGSLVFSKNSKNFVQPSISWNFNNVLTFDFEPTYWTSFVWYDEFGRPNFSEENLKSGNLNDRPRINIFRSVNGIPDNNYVRYLSGGKNVLSPFPTGNIAYPWGDRNSGKFTMPPTTVGYKKDLQEFRYSYQPTRDVFGDIAEPLTPQAYNLPRPIYAFYDGTQFGYCVKESNGLIYVSSPKEETSFGTPENGKIHIYGQHFTSQWRLLKSISKPQSNIGGSGWRFGTSFDVSKSGVIVANCGEVGRIDNYFNTYTPYPHEVWALRGGNVGPFFAQKLTNPNDRSNFGNSVAISEDGRVIAVSSPSEPYREYVDVNELKQENFKLFVYTGSPIEERFDYLQLNGNYQLAYSGNIGSQPFYSFWPDKKSSKVAINKNGTVICYAEKDPTNVNTRPALWIYETGGYNAFEDPWYFRQSFSLSNNLNTLSEVDVDINAEGNVIVFAANKWNSLDSEVIIITGERGRFNSRQWFDYSIAQTINVNNYPNSNILKQDFGKNVSISDNGNTILIGSKWANILLYKNSTGTQWDLIQTGYVVPNTGYHINGLIHSTLSKNTSFIMSSDNLPNINGWVAENESNISVLSGFADTVDLSEDVVVGLDVFTHSFAPIVTGTLYPPLNSGWTIDQSNQGELKYQYLFKPGDDKLQFNIDLDYLSICKPVVPTGCDSEVENLVYLGTGLNGCPIFECRRKNDLFGTVEKGVLYTGQTWVSGPGKAMGSWAFDSGLNSKREINNSNEFGRQSIGDRAFFIVGGTGNNLSTHSAHFAYSDILNRSLTVDVNYALSNSGFRRVIVPTWLPYEHTNGYLFEVMHSGNNELFYTRSPNLNIKPIDYYGRKEIITGDAYLKSFRYQLRHLGNGLEFEVLELPSLKSLFKDRITGIVLNDFYFDGWSTIQSGFSFEAGLSGNISANTLNNYGLYFNNIRLNFPPPPPNLSAFPDSSTSCLIRWIDEWGPVGFDIDIATDPAFRNYVSPYENYNFIRTNSNTLLTTLEVTGLKPSTNYYVRGRAYNSYGARSINSQTVEFKTPVERYYFFKEPLWHNSQCYREEIFNYTNTSLSEIINYTIKGSVSQDLLINNVVHEGGVYRNPWLSNFCGISEPNDSHAITTYRGKLYPSQTLKLEVLSYFGEISYDLEVDMSDSCLNYILDKNISGYGANSLFGTSIASSEDFSTIFIGGPTYSTPSTNNRVGGVIIYTGNKNNGWNLQYNNIDPVFFTGNSNNSEFGASLASNSDGTILAIGATKGAKNLNNIYSGEVFVYTKENETWNLKNRFTGQSLTGYEGGDTISSFGKSVSFGWNIAMNKNGNLIAVTEPFYPNTVGFLNGAIYLYTGNKQNGWKLSQLISGSNYFSLLNNISITDDGSTLFIVSPGLRFTSPPPATYGAVWIYTGLLSNGRWELKDKIFQQMNTSTQRHDIKCNSSGSTFISSDGFDRAFLYTGSVQNGWNLRQIFSGSQQEFGTSIGISENETLIFKQSPFSSNDSVNIYCGDKFRGWSLSQIISGQNSFNSSPIKINKTSDLILFPDNRLNGVDVIGLGAPQGGGVKIFSTQTGAPNLSLQSIDYLSSPEILTFVNSTSENIRLDGWKIIAHDQRIPPICPASINPETFIFPNNILLKPNETISIASKYEGGDPPEDTLPWKPEQVWNNTTDRLAVYDSINNLVINYRYGTCQPPDNVNYFIEGSGLLFGNNVITQNQIMSYDEENNEWFKYIGIPDVEDFLDKWRSYRTSAGFKFYDGIPTGVTLEDSYNSWGNAYGLNGLIEKSNRYINFNMDLNYLNQNLKITFNPELLQYKLKYSPIVKGIQMWIGGNFDGVPVNTYNLSNNYFYDGNRWEIKARCGQNGNCPLWFHITGNGFNSNLRYINNNSNTQLIPVNDGRTMVLENAQSGHLYQFSLQVFENNFIPYKIVDLGFQPLFPDLSKITGMNLQKIAAGNTSSLILNNNGFVTGWGKIELPFIPDDSPGLRTPIKDITIGGGDFPNPLGAGKGFYALLDSANSVGVFGETLDGNQIFIPLSDNKNVTSIGATLNTLILKKSNSISLYGDINTDYINRTILERPFNGKAENLYGKKIIDYSNGYFHTLFRDETTFELVSYTDYDYFDAAKIPQNLGPVAMYAAGYGYSLIITQNGQFTGIGFNGIPILDPSKYPTGLSHNDMLNFYGSGQLNIPNLVRQYASGSVWTPQSSFPWPGGKIIKLFAGNGYAAALANIYNINNPNVKSNILYTWGSNPFYSGVPSAIPDIKDLSIGLRSMLLVTNNNNLIYYGFTGGKDNVPPLSPENNTYADNQFQDATLTFNEFGNINPTLYSFNPPDKTFDISGNYNYNLDLIPVKHFVASSDYVYSKQNKYNGAVPTAAGISFNSDTQPDVAKFRNGETAEHRVIMGAGTPVFAGGITVDYIRSSLPGYTNIIYNFNGDERPAYSWRGDICYDTTLLPNNVYTFRMPGNSRSLDKRMRSTVRPPACGGVHSYNSADNFPLGDKIYSSLAAEKNPGLSDVSILNSIESLVTFFDGFYYNTGVIYTQCGQPCSNRPARTITFTFNTNSILQGSLQKPNFLNLENFQYTMAYLFGAFTKSDFSFDDSEFSYVLPYFKLPVDQNKFIRLEFEEICCAPQDGVSATWARSFFENVKVSNDDLSNSKFDLLSTFGKRFQEGLVINNNTNENEFLITNSANFIFRMPYVDGEDLQKAYSYAPNSIVEVSSNYAASRPTSNLFVSGMLDLNWDFDFQYYPLNYRAVLDAIGIITDMNPFNSNYVTFNATNVGVFYNTESRIKIRWSSAGCTGPISPEVSEVRISSLPPQMFWPGDLKDSWSRGWISTMFAFGQGYRCSGKIFDGVDYANFKWWSGSNGLADFVNGVSKAFGGFGEYVNVFSTKPGSRVTFDIMHRGDHGGNFDGTTPGDRFYNVNYKTKNGLMAQRPFKKPFTPISLPSVNQFIPTGTMISMNKLLYQFVNKIVQGQNSLSEYFPNPIESKSLFVKETKNNPLSNKNFSPRLLYPIGLGPFDKKTLIYGFPIAEGSSFVPGGQLVETNKLSKDYIIGLTIIRSGDNAPVSKEYLLVDNIYNQELQEVPSGYITSNFSNQVIIKEGYQYYDNWLPLFKDIQFQPYGYLEENQVWHQYTSPILIPKEHGVKIQIYSNGKSNVEDEYLFSSAKIKPNFGYLLPKTGIETGLNNKIDLIYDFTNLQLYIDDGEKPYLRTNDQRQTDFPRFVVTNPITNSFYISERNINYSLNLKNTSPSICDIVSTNKINVFDSKPFSGLLDSVTESGLYTSTKQEAFRAQYSNAYPYLNTINDGYIISDLNLFKDYDIEYNFPSNPNFRQIGANSAYFDKINKNLYVATFYGYYIYNPSGKITYNVYDDLTSKLSTLDITKTPTGTYITKLLDPDVYIFSGAASDERLFSRIKGPINEHPQKLFFDEASNKLFVSYSNGFKVRIFDTLDNNKQVATIRLFDNEWPQHLSVLNNKLYIRSEGTDSSYIIIVSGINTLTGNYTTITGQTNVQTQGYKRLFMRYSSNMLTVPKNNNIYVPGSNKPDGRPVINIINSISDDFVGVISGFANNISIPQRLINRNIFSNKDIITSYGFPYAFDLEFNENDNFIYAISRAYPVSFVINTGTRLCENIIDLSELTKSPLRITYGDNKLHINAVDSFSRDITTPLGGDLTTDSRVNYLISLGNRPKSVITFPTIPNKTLGSNNFNLNVTSSNINQSIIYKSNNTDIATVDSNGNVTLTGPGIATIFAGQSSTGNFALSFNSRILNVSPSQLITTESAALYNNSTWVNGTGLGGIGNWFFSSGLGTNRYIGNSTINAAALSRSGIGSSAFFFAPSTINQNNYIDAYFNLTEFLPINSSISIDSNYFWNGGFRAIEFMTGIANDAVFRIEHGGGSDFLFLRTGTTFSSIANPNIYRKAVRTEISYLRNTSNEQTGIAIKLKEPNLNNYFYENNLRITNRIKQIHIYVGGVLANNLTEQENFGFFVNNIQIKTNSLLNSPNTLIATNVTRDSFIANWDSVEGATSYQLDVSTGIAFNNFINGYNNRTVNSVSQSVTGLVGSRTYYARVRAFNTTNGPGVNSSILTQTTSPFVASTPANLRVTGVSDRSIFWAWDPVPGTESYGFTLETFPNSSPIFVLPVDTNPFGPTSYAQTQGGPNTTYYFKVRTQSPGVSNFTAESAQTTALAAPDINGVAAGRTSTSISLNWNPVATSPHSYIVEISRSFLSWSDPITYPLLATNIVTYQTSVTPSTIFSNLLPNTMHYIRFKTSNANGISRLSDRIDIATLA